MMQKMGGKKFCLTLVRSELSQKGNLSDEMTTYLQNLHFSLSLLSNTK
jgi:hypothetical protein